MLRVVTGYCGESSSINAQLAELFSLARGVDEKWAYEPIGAREVAEMFKYSWHDPREFAITIYTGCDGVRVVGAAWAYQASALGKLHTIAPYIDPRITGSLAIKVL